MGKGPRNYSDLTIKRLYSQSGNQCAFPGCPVSFTKPDVTTNLSQICHIEGAKKGSERFNSKMTDPQRASYGNLILLCANHHIETNDVKKYKVKVLKNMREEHEKSVLKRISATDILNKYPSSLAMIINHISSIDIGAIKPNVKANTYSPSKKISHNNVIRYAPLINEYKVYHGKLNKLYSEIEKQGSFKKETLLQNVNDLYLKALGTIVGQNVDISGIRANADALIEQVENELWTLFEKSPNAKTDVPIEALSLAMYIVIVDAFIRCKILEEPV